MANPILSMALCACAMTHLLFGAETTAATDPSLNNKAFLVATYSSLLQGVYDGEYLISDLQSQGDFGLGAMNSINGEFIALDGVYYQIQTSGKIALIGPRQKTPYASVCFFKPQDFFKLKGLKNFTEIGEAILPKLALHNGPYAIKIEGTFTNIQLRSLKAQSKPYKVLSEAVKQQNIYEFKNIKGTLVGFWYPSYFCNVNVPEFHFHFISEDKKKGGHLLQVSCEEITVTTMPIQLQEIYFPASRSFSKADLDMERQEILKSNPLID